MSSAEVIPFGEWLPDLPAYANPGALIAKNVIPQITGYRSLNSLSAFSSALTSVCLGSFWTTDANNTVVNFAGDATRLYQLQSSSTWTDVSRLSGGAYNASEWEFTKFGNRVLAVSIGDAIQKWDLATDTNFSNLAGSPPQARRIATVRDFVMLGDIDGLGPNYIQWSAYNNSELWTPSLSTQADFQELFGRGGKIQRIVPGEYAQIFMEHSIFRADYDGPPIIFQIDEVERKRGTPAPYSVVWSGGLTWYYGWDGFYVFDGQQSRPISANRVARWFAGNVASESLKDMRGAVDRRNRMVVWAFRTSSSLNYNNRLLLYNWAADKWSYAEVDTQILDEYVTTGLDLDSLDTVLPAGIDTDSIPVDSTEFQGGELSLMAFDSANKSGTFAGTPLTAVLDTKEIGGADNSRIYTNSVRPLVEGTSSTSVTMSVGSRERLNDNPVFSPAKAENTINGEVNVRENSRYQRFRLNISGGFDHGNGVRVAMRQQAGRR